MSNNSINNQIYDGILYVNSRQPATVGAVFGNNLDATSPASDFIIIAQTRAGGGEPYLLAMVDGTRSLCWGMDVSDNYSLKETTFAGGTGSPSFGTTIRRLSIAGEQTLPKQPCFSAYVSASSLNATGDGTNVQIVADTVSFDQQGNYNPLTGVFTASADGKYFFEFTIVGGDFDGTQTGSVVQIINPGPTYICQRFNPTNVRDSGTNEAIWTGHALLSLTSGQSIAFQWSVSGGAKVVSLVGGAAPVFTRISGWLQC